MGEIHLNLNTKVSVVLTSAGRVLYYEYCTSCIETCRKMLSKMFTDAEKDERISSIRKNMAQGVDGCRLKTELHTLISIFGPKLKLGGEIAFENNEIIIEVPD